MSEFDKQIERIKEQAKEYSVATEEMAIAKTDFTIAVLGSLMQKIFTAVDEVLEATQKKQYFDKDLPTTIKESLERIFIEFTKQKPPQIDFKPQINIDLKSIQAIAEDIGKKNDTILALIGKLPANGTHQSSELYNLITTLIGKQNVFFDRTIKQIDYTEIFKKIVELLGKKEQRIEKMVAVRGHNNILDEVKVVYK